MTTPAKMALDLVSDGLIIVDVVHSYECGSRHNGDCICDAKNNSKYISTIRAALKVLDEVQSVYAQLPETVLRDTKHRMGAEMYRDHLKQIAGE